MRRRVVVAAGVVVLGLVVALVVMRRDGTRVVVGGGSTTTTSITPTTGVVTSTTTTTTTSTTAAPSTTAPGRMTSTTTTTTPPPPQSTSPPPTTTTPAGGSAIVVRRGDANRAVVALTFDSGSDVGHANEILDYLDANGIAATFGVTGQFAETYPDVVRRMARAGNQLLNHSYSHRSFTGYSTGTAPLSAAQRVDQLERADAAIRQAAGASTVPWFRPPYGDEDASVRRDVASAGYRYEVLWTVDSLGWKGLAPEVVAQRCLDRAENGAIFLLHVGSASTDWQALPTIVDGLRQAGYGFTTVAGAQ